MVSLSDYCFPVRNIGNNVGNGNEKKEVQLVPFGEKLTFVVNPRWAEVAEYLPTSNHRFLVTFAEQTSSQLCGIYMTAAEDTDYPGTFRKALGYSDGDESYKLVEGSDSWVDRYGNPVDDLVIQGTVRKFDNDQYTDVDSMEMMASLPGVKESYRTFSRIFNVSLEAMGDDLYDEGTKETLQVINGWAFPKPDRAYIVRSVESIFVTECQIVLPTPDSVYSDASISFDIYVHDAGLPISFMPLTGSLYTYNGQVIDLTEPGYYRVIATWHGQMEEWCLAFAKMEEPS